MDSGLGGPLQRLSAEDAVAAVGRIEFVPTVLKLLCSYTGMRWSAVGR